MPQNSGIYFSVLNHPKFQNTAVSDGDDIVVERKRRRNMFNGRRYLVAIGGFALLQHAVRDLYFYSSKICEITCEKLLSVVLDALGVELLHQTTIRVSLQRSDNGGYSDLLILISFYKQAANESVILVEFFKG